ncbi:MAG: FtsX-like permease family protein [Pyrinomonadaceae bacterium]
MMTVSGTRLLGVVGGVFYERLDAGTEKTIYLSHLQNPANSMWVTVRAAASPTGLINAVRAQIRKLDPQQPVIEVKTMDQIVAASIWQPRLYTILFGVFAAIAMLLSAIGIYGAMTCSVTQRIHEIGIRMALGALAGDVLKMVIKQGMMLALIGVTIGLVAAFALTRVLSSLLYGVTATDPMTYVIVALLLASVALLACYVPARRATKVDPMVALRYE